MRRASALNSKSNNLRSSFLQLNKFGKSSNAFIKGD